MNIGGRVGGATNLSDGYDVMLSLNIFKTKFSSLLICFMMTIDGKYNTS